MKLAKKFLITLAILIGLYFVLCLFGPSQVHVEREATINAPVDAVFEQVNCFPNWNNWDYWHTIDPNTEYTYTGECGVGSKTEWMSDHEMVGHGTQEITESMANELVKTNMWFEGQGDATSQMAFTSNEDGTTHVVWSFDSDVPFMGRAFMLFMNMDEMLGPDLEKGLTGLGVYLAGAKPAFEANEVNVDPFWVLSIRDTISMEEMETIHQELYTEIGMVQQAHGVEQSDMPIAIWHAWGDTIVIEAAVPVADSVALTDAGRVMCRKVDGGACVKTTHWGWYDGLEATHTAFEDWILENGYTVSGQSRWESYEDPMLVLPDTSAVATHIYIPVN